MWVLDRSAVGLC